MLARRATLSLLCGCLLAATLDAQTSARRLLTLDDLYRMRDVGDPQLSPDGAWIAYTVTTTDTTADRTDSDIWMVTWDGSTNLRVTTSTQNEHAPGWSPDGRYLSFLSARGEGDEADQLWLINRSGGEAERVTTVPGGVSDYAWSPDGRRVVLVVEDADSAAATDSGAKAKPRPIVVDRFQFKQDEVGYRGKERQHLYLFDLQTHQSLRLTTGDFDELLPAWSPDNRTIVFVSKRRPDFDRDNNWDLYLIDAVPGAVPRALTTFSGPDNDPDFYSRPAWSPDGRWIAYLQGGPLQLIYYAVQHLAVVPAAGGPPRLLTGNLDRSVAYPAWSPDGASVLFLLEDDRSTQLARVPLAGGAIDSLTGGRRFLSGFTIGGPNGRVAVLASTPQAPAEVFALNADSLLPRSRQNDAWLGQLRLASVEETSARSKDGTVVHGFITRPPEAPAGRVPAILQIHGGPVYQFSNEFDFSWQLFASRGYAVIAANPRGSSGRGEQWSPARSTPTGATRMRRTYWPPWIRRWPQGSRIRIGWASAAGATAGFSPTT